MAVVTVQAKLSKLWISARTGIIRKFQTRAQTPEHLLTFDGLERIKIFPN